MGLGAMVGLGAILGLSSNSSSSFWMEAGISVRSAGAGGGGGSSSGGGSKGSLEATEAANLLSPSLANDSIVKFGLATINLTVPWAFLRTLAAVL